MFNTYKYNLYQRVKNVRSMNILIEFSGKGPFYILDTEVGYKT